MKLVSIIVNYRTPELVLEALPLLLRALDGIEARVLVVDNDSGDGSQARLDAACRSAGWSERVRVVASGRNGGYGFGCNFGVRLARSWAEPPEFVHLLNSDAFCRPDTVRVLLEALEADPRLGMAGSEVHDLDGVNYGGSFRFPHPLGELEQTLAFAPATWLFRPWRTFIPPPRDPLRVDWCGGISLLIRRALLEEVGLFDECFFAYFEETDLCVRARQAGWGILYHPGSVVRHVGGATSGRYDPARPIPRYWFDSRRAYFLKNHGRLGLELANAAWLAGTLGRRARALFRRADKPRLLRDFIRANYLDPAPVVPRTLELAPSTAALTK